MNTNQENKLTEFPDFLNLVAAHTDEIIFTLNQYGVFTFINNSGIEQLKYKSEEIVGKHFFELISENNKGTISETFQSLIKDNKIVSENALLIPKMGLEQSYTIKLIPVLKDDKLDQLLGIGINTSTQNSDKKKNDELLSKLTEANRLNAIERDRAKQQISVLSELNNLKNDFISNISHELRTPLASIIGFSETILEDQNLTIERAKEFNDIILTESKRLAKLINDVLDFSELENEQQSLAKTSFNVIETLKESIKSFSEECTEKNLTLTSQLADSEITIFADQERMRKAFNYLISNAVKFTNQNGRITIIAQEFLKEVEIVISDTGVGIAEEKIPLLFDKFSKVKRAGNNLPGAGFGLIAVKQIIDLHKGLIRVKSQANKGTSFIIRLPKYSFN